MTDYENIGGLREVLRTAARQLRDPCELNMTNDMKRKLAIEDVARGVIGDAAQRAIELGYVDHEDYPHIGQHDWQDVAAQALTICIAKNAAHQREYDASYNYLASLVDPEEQSP